MGGEGGGGRGRWGEREAGGGGREVGGERGWGERKNRLLDMGPLNQVTKATLACSGTPASWQGARRTCIQAVTMRGSQVLTAPTTLY